MIRKNFLSLLGVGALSTINTGMMQSEKDEFKKKGESTKRKILMKVGSQHIRANRKSLEFAARYGVKYIDAGSPKMIKGVGWDIDDARAQVKMAKSYDVNIVSYHLPLSSAGINHVSTPNIMLGNSPERDKEIEMIKQMIKVASEVGVKKLLYNTTILPVLRTGYTKDPTRGNTLYHTWNYEEALKDGLDKKELKEKGTVNREEMYNRIKYLLDRILPVAEKYDIKLGNHIADPPLPKPFDGILRWDSPNVIKQIKHFAKLYDSDSHGFNLCLGTTAEGLKGNKTKQLVSIIKWLGKRKQIFNVHMRNIRGGFNNFMETYPDNGDNDFLQIVRALRDVEYDGMIMPDHVPKHPDPESELQSFAFAFGYNKALIQAVADEVS